MTDGGILLNMGTLESDTYLSVAEDCALYNLGTMELSHSGRDTVNDKDFRGMCYNYGEIALSGHATISNGIRFGNCGRIHIREGGELCLWGYLMNAGIIRAEQGGILDNGALLELWGGELTADGGEIWNNGAIHMDGGSVLTWPEYGGFIRTFDDERLWKGEIVEVTTEEELRAALSRWDTAGVSVVSETLSVEADLRVEKFLYIAPEAALVMAEGTRLAVRDAGIINSGVILGDQITLTEGVSFKNEGVVRLYGTGSRIQIGGTDAGDRTTGEDFLLNFGTLELNGGALELSDGALAVQYNQLEQCGSLRISGNAFFANRGSLAIQDGRFHILAGGIFCNMADVTLAGDETVFCVDDGGLFCNDGRIDIMGDICLKVRGASGELNNQGTITADGQRTVVTEDGGKFTGNTEIYGSMTCWIRSLMGSSVAVMA